MEFIPTIYLYHGNVVGIHGTTLSLKKASGGQGDAKDHLKASFFSREWKRNGLGGIIYLLDSKSKTQAIEALLLHKNHIMVGGNIDSRNAQKFLDSGASHVIVDSFIFSEGQIMLERLLALEKLVGKERLLVNLSCVRLFRRGRSRFFVWPDRRQRITEFELSEEAISLIAHHCGKIFCLNFTPKGKDPESIDTELLIILSSSPVRVIYGGGLHSSSDIHLMEELGSGMLDFTLTDSLDMFGGTLALSKLTAAHRSFTPVVDTIEKPQKCILCRVL